jgi:hypothetical protein
MLQDAVPLWIPVALSAIEAPSGSSAAGSPVLRTRWLEIDPVVVPDTCATTSSAPQRLLPAESGTASAPQAGEEAGSAALDCEMRFASAAVHLNASMAAWLPKAAGSGVFSVLPATDRKAPDKVGWRAFPACWLQRLAVVVWS